MTSHFNWSSYMLLFSNLDSPLCLYVCNKLWYGIKIISNSHSASSQLSGEFILLHSIHTLTNLALKETVPPQSRTSPHVTVKNIYPIQRIQGKRKLLKNPECEKYIECNEKFQANFVFQDKRRVAQKSWMVRNIFNKVKILRESSVFEGKRKLLKFPEQWKYFQYSIFSVYSLGVIRVIWASVVCNLD